MGNNNAWKMAAKLVLSELVKVLIVAKEEIYLKQKRLDKAFKLIKEQEREIKVLRYINEEYKKDNRQLRKDLDELNEKFDENEAIYNRQIQDAGGFGFPD